MEKVEKNPLISIIVPFYNRENRLEQTLKSIACQTYSSIELILVDNGSTDGSMAICKTFQTKNNHEGFKVVLIRESRRGANAARNTGFRASSGDYLLFFDSDDLMYPDCLSIVINNLNTNNFPEIIVFPFKIQFPDGHFILRPHRFSSKPADQLYDPVISTHNVCISQSLALRNGPWDENLGRWQDLEYGFRLLLNAKEIYWIKGKPLYEVFRHEDSISGKTYSADHEKLYNSLEKIQETINQMPIGIDNDKTQRALCFKICSMAAKINQENNPTLAKKYFKESLNRLPAKKFYFHRLILWFNYFYTSVGGRGFWRLAETM